MEQTKALNSLAPFLALTKSATSPRAAADLVQRATAHPGTFLFADLLASAPLHALLTQPPAEFQSHLTLLEIFAHGTCRTYREHPQLPPLSSAQATKLRQLSLLSLAADRNKLTYDVLSEELALPPSSGLPEAELSLTVRALEDVVISAIYAGLIVASLDSRQRRVCVSSVAPLRDIAPQSTASMAAALKAWSGQCTLALADIDSRVSEIKAKALERERRCTEAIATRNCAHEAIIKIMQDGGFTPMGGDSGGSNISSIRDLVNLYGRLPDAPDGKPPRAFGNAPATSAPVHGGQKKRTIGRDDSDDEAMDLDEEEEDDVE